MKTKADKREDIRNKKKFKSVKHGIWAWAPSYIHMSKKNKNKNKKKVK